GVDEEGQGVHQAAAEDHLDPVDGTGDGEAPILEQGNIQYRHRLPAAVPPQPDQADDAKHDYAPGHRRVAAEVGGPGRQRQQGSNGHQQQQRTRPVKAPRRWCTAALWHPQQQRDEAQQRQRATDDIDTAPTEGVDHQPAQQTAAGGTEGHDEHQYPKRHAALVLAEQMVHVTEHRREDTGHTPPLAKPRRQQPPELRRPGGDKLRYPEYHQSDGYHAPASDLIAQSPHRRGADRHGDEIGDENQRSQIDRNGKVRSNTGQDRRLEGRRLNGDEGGEQQGDETDPGIDRFVVHGRSH